MFHITNGRQKALGLGFSVLLIIIDQIIKVLVLQYLPPISSAPLIPGVVGLQSYLNDGAAFGIFSGNKFILIGFTGIVLIAVTLYVLFQKQMKTFPMLALCIIIGGGFGNLIDRIFRSGIINGELVHGVVVDYIELQFMHFAIFNFADMCVTVGAVLFIAYMLFDSFRPSKDTSELEHTAE